MIAVGGHAPGAVVIMAMSSRAKRIVRRGQKAS
jgi:hypothetical protein